MPIIVTKVVDLLFFPVICKNYGTSFRMKLTRLPALRDCSRRCGSPRAPRRPPLAARGSTRQPWPRPERSCAPPLGSLGPRRATPSPRRWRCSPLKVQRNVQIQFNFNQFLKIFNPFKWMRRTLKSHFRGLQQGRLMSARASVRYDLSVKAR